MVRDKITIENLADFLEIHRNSVANKLNGYSSFTIDEAMKIQESFFPNKDLKYLFGREKKEVG